MYKSRDIKRLVRYITGECSSREKAEIRARIAVDDETARLLDQLEQAWEAAEQPFDQVNVEVALQRLDQKIQQVASTRSPAHSSEVKSMASAGARPVTIFDLSSATDRQRRPVPHTSSSFSPSRRQSGASVHLFFRVAAVLVALALTVILAMELAPPPTSPEPEALTFATGRGQRSTVQLADGSRVQLGVESRLTVPPQFAQNRREVYLEGEAYFEVNRDEDRPFVIRSGNALVEVLGTAFGIRTDKGETVVAVAEGQVALSSTSSAERDTVVLHPRSLGTLRDSVTHVRRDIDLSAYLAWREGRLVFQNTPFGRVERELERWYDLEVEVHLAPEQIDVLNATFEHESLSETLDAIAAVLDLRYTRDHRRITFYR